MNKIKQKLKLENIIYKLFPKTYTAIFRKAYKRGTIDVSRSIISSMKSKDYVTYKDEKGEWKFYGRKTNGSA